ncbi:restriction endonuclease subunit S, partial [Limosilactobacillus oris]|uniref:restriction endonuclease subunit S n=1 Tax=Limosilactobacillus oris TaxID=1632 RepID=UPI002659F213
MNEQKKKVPDLRFKGFTDDWEQCKLGDVAKVIGGGTPNTKIPAYWNGTINWYTPVEIGKKIYINESQRKITLDGLKHSSAKLLPKNSVLFTSRAGIGKMAILGEEATTNQGFQSIIPIAKELDSYFLFSLSNQLKYYGETHGAGSTFTEISGKELAKFKLILPKLNEQKIISKLIMMIDKLISLQQRKLDLLKQLKKGLLQKMFADKDSKRPILRFSGFTKDWKQCKLGKLARIDTGKLNANAMVMDGKYDFYTSGKEKYKIDKYAFVGPAITVAGNGATVGYMHYADNKFNAYQRTYVLTNLKGDRRFLFNT